VVDPSTRTLSAPLAHGVASERLDFTNVGSKIRQQARAEWGGYKVPQFNNAQAGERPNDPVCACDRVPRDALSSMTQAPFNSVVHELLPRNQQHASTVAMAPCEKQFDRSLR
jgi:hypothetical protein